MPRNKVLERAKVSMPSGRSAFDVSQIRNTADLLGEIGVCYCRPMVAGTKGKIGRETFTRTAQVVSPAFHRVTEHFDFFVVPIHSLWRQWENWKLNINDMQDTYSVPWDTSNNFPDMALPANCPRLDFYNLVEALGLRYDGGPAPTGMVRKANDVLRLLDELNYGAWASSYASTAIQSRVMNIFKAAAYQKCYYDHYRNTAYESNNPYAYNFDWLYSSTRNGILGPSADHTQQTNNSKDCVVGRYLFTRHRVNYRNDYYHNIYPSLNYVNSRPRGTDWQIPSNIGQLLATYPSASVIPNGPSVASDGTVITGQSAASLSGGQSIQASTRGVTVQSIRAAFALDKLMRASAYAPKHVKDQYKALYGVDGVEDFDMRSERIGSFQSDVILQEVTNMANTSSNALGELGAKGVGASDKDSMIDFYCKYDSIVIGLHYFSLRGVYDADGIDPWNSYITRESFFVKAFEKLGLRPFYFSNLNAKGNNTALVMGWTEGNYPYKIEADYNYGPFKDTFETYDVNGSGVIVLKATQQDALSTFVPHTLRWFMGSTLLTAEYFKIAPEDMDNVFATIVPEEHPIGYYQFYGTRKIKCAIVSPMAVHSQPVI